MSKHVVDLAFGKNHASASMNSSGYHAASFVEHRDELKLQSCLERLGVAPNSRIALIHVRNSSHDIQTGMKDGYDVNFVNASPENFQAAVNHLIAEGFSVLTVGNHATSPSGLEGVTEYHKSALRTPMLDFLIGKRAGLFLGTTAGALSGVAFHFRLPSLLTNHLIWNSEITAEPFSYGRAIFLLKGVTRDGSQLSHGEVMSSRLPSSDRALRELGISLQENSGADILAGVKELLALGDDDELWNRARRGADQHLFWQVFDSRTRLERVCKEDGAVMSPSFLKANPHWLR